MALKFYHKIEPKNSPVLSNGSKCVFSTIDHLNGFFCSDNPYVWAELERLMSEGKYGMSEITEQQFHADFVEPKKKLDGRPLRPLWREEVANRPMLDTVFAPQKPKVDPVAAVVEAEVARQLAARAVPVAAADAADGVAAAIATSSAPVAEFKPTVAKRSKLKGAKPPE